MNIALLGNVGTWHLDQLTAAAGRRGHRLHRAEFDQLACDITPSDAALHAGELRLSDMDAVLVRIMPAGSLEQVVWRMDVLQQLSRRGTLVVNPPRAIECAVDKALTTLRLQAGGIPTPRTVVCETAERALAGFESLGRDVVVKPLFGSEGRGIVRVSDGEIAARVFHAIQRIGSVLYLQEFIPHRGSDLRLLVLGTRVLGAMRRTATRDFRTNIAQQGMAAPHMPTDEEARLALRAAQAVGACFAGVDLMYDAAGRCLVLEVNAVPGWRALQPVAGVNIAEELIDYLEREVHASGRVGSGG